MSRSYHSILLGCALLVAGSLSVGALAQQPQRLDVARVDDSVIVLTDSTHWQPGLYAIEHLATLPAPHGLPYFVFGAYYCNECDAGPDLWILRAHDSVSAAAAVPYPGTHNWLGENKPYGEGRTFVGRCLGGGVAQLVSPWHVDTLPAVPDSVFTVTADGSAPRVVRASRTPAFMPSVRRALASGMCRELQRATRTP